MIEITYIAVFSFALANSRKDRGDGNNNVLHVYSSSHIFKGLYVHSFIWFSKTGSLGLRSITEEKGHLFKVIQMTIKMGLDSWTLVFATFSFLLRHGPETHWKRIKELGVSALETARNPDGIIGSLGWTVCPLHHLWSDLSESQILLLSLEPFWS